jgi:anti-sigma B factor antagonist
MSCEQPIPQQRDQWLTVTLNQPRPRAIRCAVTGEVDVLTAPALRAQLMSAGDVHCRDVVVDLTAVTFFAAAGLHVLDDVRHAHRGARELLVVGASPQVDRVFDLCGPDYPRFATCDQALASCG